MLELKFPEIKDREWVQPIFSRAGGMGSEFAFGTMFVWRHTYVPRICRYKDFVLSSYGEQYNAYAYPVGTGDRKEAILALQGDAKERGVPFRMWGLSRENCGEIEAFFPGKFQLSPLRQDFDYIYRTEDLIRLAGRKYHGKRNHLARFNRTYSWEYEEIGPQNFSDCLEIVKGWEKQAEEEENSGETLALEQAFSFFSPLRFSGGLIRVDGRPAAFTLGEALHTSCFLLHFEKALDQAYTGIYAAINHEFARRNLESFVYVNREEDMGIEGLRKAKMSYRPAFLLEKYSAVLKEDMV